jgi:hypothetical protein
MVKERDFEAEKNQNKCKKIKHPTLVLSYGHFPARSGSKSTITSQKSGEVNKGLYWFLTDNC